MRRVEDAIGHLRELEADAIPPVGTAKEDGGSASISLKTTSLTRVQKSARQSALRSIT